MDYLPKLDVVRTEDLDETFSREEDSSLISELLLSLEVKPLIMVVGFGYRSAASYCARFLSIMVLLKLLIKPSNNM